MQTYVYIDPCTLDLTVRIEKFGLTTSLHDYTWGSTRVLYLNGAVHLELSVDDLYYQNQSVRQCLFRVSGSLCDRSAILENSLLDRLPCNWESTLDLNNPDFALTNWANDKGQNLANPLSTLYVSLLKEDLGIAVYLQENVCDCSLEPYSIDGWKDECGADYKTLLPTTASIVTCPPVDL
ncbi:uncharacterized protein LOC117321266 [Pecten maximus]|uniref:uncharacterized protein LOC117321266 n=1 Tax=Pecten maximus TaxID=6579 RepID=UPI0014584B3B|nr:uncharacterized protein LOC117321266 [Pecten maximus]